MPGRTVNIERIVRQTIQKAIVDGIIPVGGGGAAVPGPAGPAGTDGHSPIVEFGTAANADVLSIDGTPGPHLTGPPGQTPQAPSPNWGGIGGILGNQTDLTAALDAKDDAGAGYAEAAEAIVNHNGAYDHTLLHSPANDPTAAQKAALAGTNGTPSATNKLVTDSDPRNTNVRTPTAHSHPESEVTNLATDLAGKAANPVYAALSNGATAMAFGTNDVVKVTPNVNATYTTTVPPAGRTRTLIILTSGTTSYTITFGSGFKPTGTLATGTTSARVFVIHFVSDGTNLYEAGRTAAMVA